MNDTALFEATELLDWISLILNYSQYVIALLLVVLIAACFLGRTVVLSKKLVLMAFGLFALCGITSVIENILFIEDEEIIKLISYILTAGMYFYAFLFYLFAFREKRVIRAIESAVCYFVLTVYITNFSYMIVIYLIGGTEEALNSVY